MPLDATQTEDVGGVQGVAQEVGIALKGEAYAIDVAVKYPEPAATLLDYSLMKATQTASKSVTLVNSGKYAVAYALHLRGAAMKELFSISPAEGSLTPGAQQALELTFNKYVSVSPHFARQAEAITLEPHLANIANLHLTLQGPAAESLFDYQMLACKPSQVIRR